MTKTMYKTILKSACQKAYLVLLLLTLFGVKESRASHAAGADLTYTSLGNGQYLVTFSFYRDCFGIPAPTTQDLNVSSTLCNFNQTFTMNQVPGTGQEITHPCSTATTTCGGGNQPGIQLYEYTAIVTLNGPCADWQFNTYVSARNAAVTNIVSPDNYNLYVDAFLNNTVSENNSPDFTIDPIAFICVGQNNHINHGVIDADGDSLVYSFIVPRSDQNTALPYQQGFSVQNPISANPLVSIDPLTGDIIVNPTTAGEIDAMAVLIQEYRDGQLIGTVMRDMQIYVVACSNTNPDVSGIDTTTSFATSTCIGAPLCFNVVSSDPDPNDTLTMTYNIASVPGATFTVTPGVRPVGTFCWTPTAADARPQPYTFIVTVRDNACPSNGVVSIPYFVTVSNMTINLTSTPEVACNGDLTGSASATSTGHPPLTYDWTLPGGQHLNTPSLSNLGAGAYVLSITDSTGCMGVENFNIAEPAELMVDVTGTNAGCGGAAQGSALATVTGGTPNYSYHWSNNSTANPATGLATGNYTVTVTDDHQCTASDSVHIVALTAVDFTIHSTPATCVANDGSVWVTHTGGVGPFSYHWSNTIDTTNSTQNNLITGSYDVTAIDLGSGCSETLNAIVQNASGLSATITSSTDATCASSEDGSATVLASGGQPPYSYLWPNGDTTASTNHLAPGTHTVMVEDYAGCRAYANVTIGAINPAPVVELGPDTMPCTGTPYMMDAGPGAASYLWSDNSTGQTLTVGTTGVYSVVVTNQFGCQSFDAINVTFVTCVAHPNTNTPQLYGGYNPNVRQHANNVIIVYPNPVIDEFTVGIPHIHDSEVTLTMNDILGNTVYHVNENAGNGFTKKINTHTLPAGIYLLKVEYNGEMSTTRIIKQ